MIGLGLACSHAGGLWVPPERWQERMEPAAGVLERYPEARRQRDSLEACQEIYARAHACFAELRKEVEAYQPEVIVFLGDDQNDLFSFDNNPTFAIYVGEEDMWGHTGHEWDVPMKDRTVEKYHNHAEMAGFLARGLVKEGFDISTCHKFNPVGREGYGLPHMASRIARELDPSGEIPIVCVFMNEYFPPLPTGKRCADLGRAVAKILNARPERIALVASGGLSHAPMAGEINRGDIDIPLDTWVLERIERNDVEALEAMFSFDSQTLRSGTGEIRAWISVAAAMDRPARILDYIPVFTTYTGCGFATWEAVA